MIFNKVLLVCMLPIITPLDTASFKENSDKKSTMKRNNTFGEFALAEYLFSLADINKDKNLDKNEIYNFYRHYIGFPFEKAAKMSIKLMNLGDLDKDEKLGEIEAVLAFGKVKDRITKL